MLLTILAAMVYFPVFSQEVGNHDEIAWIKSVEPPSVHTAKLVVTWAPSRFSDIGYYAPLTALSIMADLWVGNVFGNRDAVLKGTNLALHTLNTLLVLLLMRTMRMPPWPSFAVAILFCLHPLQVSSVAWIAERKNLLMASCFLGGMLCYHQYRRSSDRRWYPAVLGLYVLGLSAKPSAVALGPCLFITDWFLIDRRLTRQSVLRVAPFIMLGLLWTGAAMATEGTVVDAPPLFDRLLMIPYKIAFMIGKFLAPVDLTHIYPPVAFDIAATLSWGLAPAFCAALCVLLIMHRREPIWVIFWALGFYFLNLAPSLGIVPFNGMRELYVADHYQYVSIIGASLLAVLGVNRLLQGAGIRSGRAVGAALLCLTILGLGTLSAQHLRIWSNAESLWTHVIASNPGSHTAHYNYGHYLDERGRYPEAVREYRLALSANERAYRAYNNLGIIMMKFGRLDTAISYFRKCSEVNPTFGESHLSLAKIYFFQEKFEQAEEHCRKAAELGAECSPEGLKQAEQEKRKLKEMGR
jgi:hypothetical protein